MQKQPAHLRAGRIEELDLANIAEELDEMGIAQYHQPESTVRVLLMHMLEWGQQPEMRGRGWVGGIVEQRSRIERLLHKNPSLKSRTTEACEEAYASAVRCAATETDYVADDSTSDQPYSWTDILNRRFELEGGR